jgi:hypothetical protein
MPGLLLAASDKCGWQHHRCQVRLRRRSCLFRWGPRCIVTSAVWAFSSDNGRPSAVSSTGGAHGHGAHSEPTESIPQCVLDTCSHEPTRQSRKNQGRADIRCRCLSMVCAPPTWLHCCSCTCSENVFQHWPLSGFLGARRFAPVSGGASLGADLITLVVPSMPRCCSVKTGLLAQCS